VIITLSPDITADQRKRLHTVLGTYSNNLRETYFRSHMVMITPDVQSNPSLEAELENQRGVQRIDKPDTDYQLAARSFTNDSSQFAVNGEIIGNPWLNVVAGPCSIESREQVFEVAHFLSEMGVRFIRGGAYKPRTSPYTFQGLGHEGLTLIREAADAYGLAVVSELMDKELIPEFEPLVDIYQVGSRNMFNYYLLKALGSQSKPVLLKRGMYATLDEWLLAAEYIMVNGNEAVILCERGLRTYDPAVRNQLDLAAIPLLQEKTHLPIWVDPSQGTGKRSLIAPMSQAAVAAGSDGLMIEVHPDPDKAFSDASQTIDLHTLRSLLQTLEPLSNAKGKQMSSHAERSITT
jgi:3-deoxy-7-phosphoheptulonate synthase